MEVCCIFIVLNLFNLTALKNLIFSLLLISAIAESDCKAQVTAADSLALVTVYSELGPDVFFPNVPNPIGWGNGPVGSWPGVTVENFRVTGIELSQNAYIMGIISPAIGQLTALKRFGLRLTNVSGTVPPEIGNLPALEYLDLTTTEELSVNNILSYLMTDTSLVYLNLSGKAINAPIPATIGNLTHLTVLKLYNCNINGSIPSSIGNLTRLTELDLSINPITGILPSTIGNCVNLQKLNIFSNGLIGRIPPSIGNLVNLTELQLHANQLSDSIPYSIGNLLLLTKLSLRNNQLNFPIPASIGNLTKLTSLDLSNNQLTGSLTPAIGNLVKLTRLTLAGNRLQGTIPFSSFTSFNNYISLDLSTNQFNGSLPPDISNLKLKTLNLFNNLLTGNIPSTISPFLDTLILSANRLSGPVPASVSGSTTIESVRIHNNFFTFDGMEAFSQATYSKSYAPQINGAITIRYSNYKLTVTAGGELVNNIYKWYKNGVLAVTTYGDSAFTPVEAGNYSVSVLNAIANQLTLNSDTITVSSVSAQVCTTGSQITSTITGSSYQWQVNTGSGFINITDDSNYAGSNTNTLQFSNIPTAWYGYQYRAVVDNTVTSTPTNILFVNRWTGAAGNGQWEDDSNWSCGYIPDSNTDVTIVAGTVVVSADASIRSLSLSPGVNFIVSPGVTLTVAQ